MSKLGIILGIIWLGAILYIYLIVFSPHTIVKQVEFEHETFYLTHKNRCLFKCYRVYRELISAGKLEIDPMTGYMRDVIDIQNNNDELLLIVPNNVKAEIYFKWITLRYE